ncbi:HD domain-containing protein [Dacryopinax primogenitus]|uniref:5'-deoxynucleotidase n=1 Tax=Dacryopinax primogenitus (strain DJM 731) TaxID=1858805 RepID=M5G4G4_DACPD|nr:HD domain-containing protein [Dacryopinax primogenitus]EJU03589.1 HD domain-containing protein [Dacryopinax primogenitus]
MNIIRSVRPPCFRASILSRFTTHRMSSTAPKRIFPPLYSATGNVGKDRLAFFHIIERLKTQKRTGWVQHKIPEPESIADHMYRMAVLAMCCEDATLDIAKCVMLAVVHDLAEAQVGDIAPSEGFSKSEKNRLEAEAMENFVQEMLHESEVGLRIQALWMEYEEGKTPEARFVKDLDRMEMALQATEYEKRYDRDLQEFIDSSIPKLQHPEVKQWGDALMEERQARSTENPSSS